MEPQTTKKRKHKTLTLSEEWAIIQRHSRGESPAALSTIYGIGRPTVYDIIKNKDKIERFMKSVASEPGNRKTLKSGENPKVEEALYAWFHQQRERNAPISGDILKEKAKFFYEEIKKKQDFRASDGWLDNFKRRFGIRFLQISGEKLSADESEIDNFVKELEIKIKNEGLTLDQVYNADETGLNWRQLPTSTFVTRGETSAPGRKMKKERLTLMPCTNASGSHKLKLLVVGKTKNPRAFKNVKHENLPVVYTNQSRAWVSREVFKSWYQNDFVPEVKQFLTQNKMPLKALLLLDNAPGHPLVDKDDLKVKTKDGFIEIMFLPANTTAIIQPLDQNVIKTMKMHYKKRLLMDIVSNPEPDIALLIKNFNIKDAVINAAYAWDQVTTHNILTSWKKVWPNHPLLQDKSDSITKNQENENDDEFLDSLSMVCGMQNKKFNEEAGLPYQDLVNWLLQADLEADLTDQEIVDEMTLNEDDVYESDMSEMGDVPGPAHSYTITADEAVLATTTLLRWAEERNVGMEHVLLLKNIQEKVVSESFKVKKQKTIDDYFNQVQ